LSDLITVVHADLETWRPPPRRFALVLGTGYWDPAVFAAAADGVVAGGLLGWQALTAEARRVKPEVCSRWCLDPGEPASLLPAGCAVLSRSARADAGHSPPRRMRARREQPGPAVGRPRATASVEH